MHGRVRLALQASFADVHRPSQDALFHLTLDILTISDFFKIRAFLATFIEYTLFTAQNSSRNIQIEQSAFMATENEF